MLRGQQQEKKEYVGDEDVHSLSSCSPTEREERESRDREVCLQRKSRDELQEHLRYVEFLAFKIFVTLYETHEVEWHFRCSNMKTQFNLTNKFPHISTRRIKQYIQKS